MMQHYWKDVGGWFKFKAAFDRILAGLPADKPSTFVEIGLWLGRSTAYLGVEIINSGKPVRWIGIDHFNGQPEIVGWRAELVSQSHAMFLENTAPIAAKLQDRFRLLVSKSVPAAEQIPDDSVDVVWLDGAHDYSGVTADIQAWWPKLKVGGFIGGDDVIKCIGVREAVRDRFGDEAAKANEHWWLLRRLDHTSVECLT